MSYCLIFGGARLPNDLTVRSENPVSSYPIVSIRLSTRRLVRRSFLAPQSSTEHLAAKSEPWPSAGSRLGALPGLAISSEQNRHQLRFNHKVVREPRPPTMMSRSSSLPQNEPPSEVQGDAAKSVAKTAAPSNLPLRIASKASFA